MKKTLLAAALALCAIGSQSCKKDDYKPDIVKYKIDGKEKIIEGVFSHISLYGLEIHFDENDYTFTAHHESMDFDLNIGAIPNSFPLNTPLFFRDATSLERHTRIFVDCRIGSTWRSYGSINEETSSMTLLQNNDQCVEGTFSGTLYNNTTSATSSDSVLITDGYFYLNKE